MENRKRKVGKKVGDVLKVYLKVLLATGIPFGFIMGAFTGFILSLFVGFQKSLIIGIIIGVLLGVVFGVLLSLIVSSIHVRSINKLVAGFREHKYSVRQSLSINVTERADIIYDNFLSKVKNKTYWSITDQEHGSRIVLMSSFTMKSFGEIITITFRCNNDDITKIEVESRPKLQTTIIDNGKNLENVLTIERLFDGFSIA